MSSNKLPIQYKLDGVQFNPRDRIATGGEAVIYRGMHNGHPVAVREIVPISRSEVPREQIHSQVLREVITQWQADHPNLLRIRGVFMEGDTPLIVLPYLHGGSPMQVLGKTGDSQKLSSMLQGIVSGLKHLHHHQPPIIHGDIHPDNFMLDENGVIVLGDFGLSRIRHAQNRTHTVDRSGGKDRYIAPELYAYQAQGRATEASDTYSLAMTFLALATLEQPFSDIEFGRTAASAAKCGMRPAKPSKTQLLSGRQIDRLWPLFEKMWSRLPADRPSIAQVECELNTFVVPAFQREPFIRYSTNCRPDMTTFQGESFRGRVMSTAGVRLAGKLDGPGAGNPQPTADDMPMVQYPSTLSTSP